MTHTGGSLQPMLKADLWSSGLLVVDMSGDGSEDSPPLPPPPGGFPPPPKGMPAPPPTLSASPASITIDEPNLPTPPPLSDTENAVNHSDIVDLNALSSSSTSNLNRDQMYGHIDRIASGEVGTLLDRFADRFGSELDREIIVLRRKEQQNARESQPIVELISTPDDEVTESTEQFNESEIESEIEDFEEEYEDEEEPQESGEIPALPEEMVSRLESDLARVTKQIKPLQQKYKLAKQRHQSSKVKKLAPKLRSLMNKRNLIIEVMEGTKHPSSLVEPSQKKIKKAKVASKVDDDKFPEFVSVVNDLLGDMPDSFVEDFILTPSFVLLQSVAEDPSSTKENDRRKFFEMANKELGDLPENKLDTFVKSEGFVVFQKMGELYG